MFIAVLVLLLAHTVPHHHHGGIACIDTEIYSEHSEHAEDHNNTEHSFCLDNVEFLLSKTDISSHINNTLSCVNTVCAITIDTNNIGVVVKHNYAEYPKHFKSSQFFKSSGMRAPPLS